MLLDNRRRLFKPDLTFIKMPRESRIIFIRIRVSMNNLKQISNGYKLSKLSSVVTHKSTKKVFENYKKFV